MRLKLVPEKTNWDFFSRSKLTLGLSALLIVLGMASFLMQGLNYGIDFRGGTTVRTDSSQPVDVAAYRDALAALELGDISITQVFDPGFEEDQNVAMVRIEAQEGSEAVTADTIRRLEQALGQQFGGALSVNVLRSGDSPALDQDLISKAIEAAGYTVVEGNGSTESLQFTLEAGLPVGTWETILNAMKDAQAIGSINFNYETMSFPSVESVGPKVSGELIQTAAIAVVLAIMAVLFYIWLRFEWQFALGAVAALVHDVVLTLGVFSALQIKFDLAIIAALLTIVGYSLNDTVVVFDRVRENLRKYSKKALDEVLNLSINETLSRTVMTSVTTLLALIALYVLGGDVIRGFVFAMIWGVIVGTYSSVFVASAILLRLGVKRDWSKPDANAGNQYGNVDP